MESEKTIRVLQAALSVFLRYGYRRVTMQDIANEAGISRPALYLVFPNKEEVFKKAVLHVAAANLQEIQEGVCNFNSPEERLLFTFEIWTVKPYELILNSPNSRDLIECGQSFARETIQQTYRDFETVLAGILEPLLGSPKATPLSADQIARLLASAVQGFKERATTGAELRTMIAGLITLTLAALDIPATTKTAA